MLEGSLLVSLANRSRGQVGGQQAGRKRRHKREEAQSSKVCGRPSESVSSCLCIVVRILRFGLDGLGELSGLGKLSSLGELGARP